MKTLIVAALLAVATGTAAADEDLRRPWFDENSKAWSKLDGFEQASNLFRSGMGFADASYIVDAIGDKLTALGRTAYVFQCLAGDEEPIAWSMCQGDVEAFDAKKALAEIDADTAHVGYHESAKKLVAEAKGLVDALPAKWKKAIDKDGAYKKAFDIGVQARKQAWGSPELRAVVADVEDAWRTGSRKAMAGCEAKVWPQWVKAVSAIPADKFTLAYKDQPSEALDAQAATITNTVDGYLAAVAVIHCFPLDASFEVVAQTLVFTPGLRGPRTGAFTLMWRANLRLDKKGENIRWQSVDRREWFPTNAPMTTGNGGRDVILSATPKGDKVHIVYSDIKEKTTKCVDYHEGTTPSRIDEHGNIIYESSCGNYADVMVSYTAPAPSDDDRRYATGLKPGVFVHFRQEAISWVAATTTSKHPFVVLGAPVK